MIFVYFFNISELITLIFFILSKYAMAMKFSALSKNVFDIMMQITEQKYYIPKLRYGI